MLGSLAIDDLVGGGPFHIHIQGEVRGGIAIEGGIESTRLAEYFSGQLAGQLVSGCTLGPSPFASGRVRRES
jgi:hypothetical protein